MLFNSLSFLGIFLPLVLAIALRLRGPRLLWWLTLISAVFYALAGQVWFLAPMAVTVVLDYSLAPFIARAEGRRRTGLMLISVVCNLSLLFYFKYISLFLRTVEAAFHLATGRAHPEWLNLVEVALPAGISFYTFQSLSYVIDVYRGTCEPEHRFAKFSSFIAFFPHLVAGPITRHNQLIPQLAHIEEQGIRPRWEAGVLLFAVGLCKKVLIADRLGNLIDPLLIDTSTLGALAGWLALLGFALQVYFDFSGYSDMAIGLGRLFGVELPQNFNSPYQSRNPVEYWQRWHISLGTWIRDYVFNPLALEARRRSSKLMAPALLVTMLLAGLWHGAGWTFAAFGLYHGCFILLFVALRSRWTKWPNPAQRILTFVVIVLGDVLFRAHGFGMARQWFAALFGAHGAGALVPAAYQLTAFIAAGMAIVHSLPNASSFQGFERLRASYQFALATLTALAVLLMNYSSRFIYFQF